MAVEGDRAVWRAEAQGLELLETTIGTLPDRHADEDPEKEALVYHYPELGLDMRPT